MPAPAAPPPDGVITFVGVILALHVLAVVLAFGVLFSYPLFMVVGARLDPTAMPWFHRMQQIVGRYLVSPGLLFVVIFGVILASEDHAWKRFYVQWGIGAAIVIGAVEGMVLIPRTGRLADLARADLESGPSLGSAYRAVLRQVSIATAAVSVIVVVTVFLMAVHAGA